MFRFDYEVWKGVPRGDRDMRNYSVEVLYQEENSEIIKSKVLYMEFPYDTSTSDLECLVRHHDDMPRNCAVKLGRVVPL